MSIFSRFSSYVHTQYLSNLQDESAEDEGVEHLSVYGAEELSRFDAEECKKNIANMEGVKNK